MRGGPVKELHYRASLKFRDVQTHLLFGRVFIACNFSVMYMCSSMLSLNACSLHTLYGVVYTAKKRPHHVSSGCLQEVKNNGKRHKH